MNQINDINFFADHEKYISQTPFPYIVYDNFLKHEIATEIFNSFPNVDSQNWIHYLHFNESKHGFNKLELLPESIRQSINYLNSTEFIKQLELLTGINNLIADNSLEGGGLHQTLPGGKLNIHTDFTTHTFNRNWQRRVNLIIYLNKDWKDAYNGHLELWDSNVSYCAARISPNFNRCVIFSTSSNSFHGVPEKLQCPEGETRKSIALYYYTHESKPYSRATLYKGSPDDSFIKHFLINLDNLALKLYSLLKRKFNFNDDLISRILRKIKKN